MAAAIERLREAGFEMELTLKLEIGLRPQSHNETGSDGEGSLDLTEEDLRVLNGSRTTVQVQGARYPDEHMRRVGL